MYVLVARTDCRFAEAVQIKVVVCDDRHLVMNLNATLLGRMQVGNTPLKTKFTLLSILDLCHFFSQQKLDLISCHLH
jgi:hypothetical protein